MTGTTVLGSESTVEQEELAWGDIVDALLAKWIQIVAIPLILSVSTYGVVMLGEPRYIAEAVVVPQANDDLAAALPAQLGLASFAKSLNGSAASDSRGRLAEVLVETKDFAHVVLHEAVLQARMLAPDPESPSGINAEMFDVANARWIWNPIKGRELGRADGKLPEGQLYKAFHDDFFGYSVSATEGVVRLSFIHSDPVFAEEMLEIIIDEVNRQVREWDLAESREAVAYLQQELERTASEPIRMSLLEVLEGQLKRVAMASVRSDYVWRVLDPPRATDGPVFPRPGLWALIAAVLSVALVSVWAIVRHQTDRPLPQTN